MVVAVPMERTENYPAAVQLVKAVVVQEVLDEWLPRRDWMVLVGAAAVVVVSMVSSQAPPVEERVVW